MLSDNRHRALISSWVLVSALALGRAEAIYAQEIAPPGLYTVGSKLSDVRNLPHSDNCVIQDNYADCTFTDSNGVSYIVYGNSVTNVTMKEKTTEPRVKLAFDLEFGDTFDNAIPKLVSPAGRTWLLGKDPSPPSGVYAICGGQFLGANEVHFSIRIYFQGGRLVAVDYSTDAV
jgi:hypothetical protein